MQPEAELTCAEVVELVTDYLEGRLPDGQRRRFDEHLTACDGCNAYVEQMRKTIAVSGHVPPAEVSPELQQRLLEAFRGWRSPG
jgi:anti-sigma factor RsiW